MNIFVCFAEQTSQLSLLLDSSRKSLLEFLQLVSSRLLTETLVSDFERTGLLDDTIERRAVGTLQDLSTCRVDLLSKTGSLQVF